MPVRASVERGGEVTMTLEAIAAYGTQIDFEISAPPEHGSLTVPRRDSDHTAVVTYRHDGTKQPDKDRFFFRCKAPGRTKSVPYPVEIKVTPPPARLVFEAGAIEFGDVPLAERRRTNVTIANVGGTRVKGRLILPPGFSAPEGEAFNLGEGERANMMLEFSPGEERHYEESCAFLPSSGDSFLKISGSGRARFDLSKRDSLDWEVTNTSGLPITISCNGGEGWALPPEIPVNAGGSVLLTFRQSSLQDAPSFASTSSIVHVSDGLSTIRIELPPPVPFVPVLLKALTRENLGSVPMETILPVRFRVENPSPAAKSIKWSASSRSGGGTSTPKSLELMPGAREEILFEWRPQLSGEAQLKITVEEGVNTIRELFWKATLIPATTPSAADGIPAVTTGVGEETPVAEGEVPEQRGEAPSPPLDGLEWAIRKSWSGIPRLLISFTNKPGSNSKVRVDELRLQMTSEEMASLKKSIPTNSTPRTMVLTPLPIVKNRTQGGRMTLEVGHLSPGCHQIVVALLSPGGGAAAVSQFQIVMPPKYPWWKAFRVPMGIMILFFLFLFYRRMRIN